MSDLHGHDGPIAAFLNAMRGTKLHHAWLLTGAVGIGKASVAIALAKRLLAEAAGPPIVGQGVATPPDHPIAKLIDAGSHPDFHLLDRLPKDAKLIREEERRNWPVDVERVRSITVEQVRALGSIFGLMPSFSAKRVVVIDAIDDMERSGANALLKMLEEPPQGTIFLAVSHAPGRLLPTIRSRCRILRFAPLDDVNMRGVLRTHLPNADESELTSLLRVGQGSPGRALNFAGLDIGAIDAAMADIAKDGDASNAKRAGLAQALALKSAQQRYEAFLARAPAFIADQARARTGDALASALDAWDGARSLAESAQRQSLDPQMTVFAMASHIAALAPKAASSKS
ncbi:MAG: AAA family ATPase [Sphingomonadaceae bacterium]